MRMPCKGGIKLQAYADLAGHAHKPKSVLAFIDAKTQRREESAKVKHLDFGRDA